MGIIGDVVGGIFGAVAGANQAKKEEEIADRNFQFQQEQFNYQKELNQKQMEREDNAVQRRAKDLEQAGMSKNLAAGSSASAGAMSAGTAPQKQATLNAGMQALQFGSHIAGQVQNITQGNAQTNLTNQQSMTESKKRDNIEQDTKNKVAEQALTEANKTLVDKQASNYEKKLAQEIKESNMRIKKMEMDNQLTQVNKDINQNRFNFENQVGVPLDAIKSGTIMSQLGLDVANYSNVIGKQLGTIFSPQSWKGLWNNIKGAYKK